MDRTKGKELIERRARSRQSRSKKDLWWGRTRSPSLLESLYSLVGGNQRWPGLLHYLSSDSGVTMDLQQYEHLVFRPSLVFSFLFSSRSPHIDTRTNQPNETAKLNIYIYGNTACHCIGFKYPRGVSSSNHFRPTTVPIS